MKDRIAYKKLMLYQNIMKSDNKRAVKKIVKEQMKWERKTTWYASVEKEILKYNIKLNPEEITKSRWKKNVKKAISKKVEETLRTECTKKTKGRTVMYNDFKKKEYLTKLPLHLIKHIIKTRLHMSKIPQNYKGTSVNKCPLCNDKNNKIEHYVQCKQTRKLAEIWGVSRASLDREDIPTLKRSSRQITTQLSKSCKVKIIQNI